MRDHQDVGEQDRPVEAEATDRLERDFGRRCTVVGKRQEAALLFPQRPVLGEVAPGLAHQPQGNPIAPLSVQCLEQGAGHRACVQSNKTKILRGMMESVGPVESGDSRALPDFSPLG